MASLAPCTCGIDVHAHVVPEHFPAYIGRTMPAEYTVNTTPPPPGPAPAAGAVSIAPPKQTLD